MMSESDLLGRAPIYIETLDNLSRKFETGPSGKRVIWRSWGHGPTLLLLHGGAGSWRHWIRNIPVLSLRYRVVAPDLPGMGESDAPAEPSRPQHMAERLRCGLEAILGPDSSYDLVGFSFGGLIGGHLAVQDVGRAKSLTIIGTTGWPGLSVNPIKLVSARGLPPEEMARSHYINLARLMIADPAHIDDTAIWMQNMHSRLVRIDSRETYRNGPLTEVIPKLDIPVNGIWGEKDAIAYPRVLERRDLLEELARDLEFTLITGGGHWVQYEKPDEFNEILLRNLARSFP